jgi:hypothetical protein
MQPLPVVRCDDPIAINILKPDMPWLCSGYSRNIISLLINTIKNIIEI